MDINIMIDNTTIMSVSDITTETKTMYCIIYSLDIKVE